MLWLDSNLAMNYRTWTDLDLNPAGPAVNLGGAFTTPPVGVAVGANRLDVFGLGLDYAVYHKMFGPGSPTITLGGPETPPAGQWSAHWENLGGNCTCTPVAISTAADRIDLFVLGVDQGMLHLGWRASAFSAISTVQGPGKWSAWDELGGGFTSPPAVLAGANGAFEIFGRGLDFQHLSRDLARARGRRIGNC